MKDPIINFYELDKIKKYMPKIDDEQVKYTGMPLFKHILICGGTGSGKSNATMNYLRRTCELTQTYDPIQIIHFQRHLILMILQLIVGMLL